MKYEIASVLVFFVSGVVSFAGPAATKTPFYRQRDARAPRPKSNRDPVVVNAASFEAGVSPGCLATVFGTDLTSVSDAVVAQTTPLPTRLAGVTVLVNGVASPIYSIAYANGEDQISFQVPNATPTGPGAVQVEVLDGDFETANIVTDSFTEDPGIFAYNGDFAVAVNSTDGSLIGPDNPALPGDTLVLYTTGLGPVSIDVPDGFPAPGNPLAFTVDPLQVLVDNENAPVFFSGLAPGFVGLYQVNFRVPFDARSGDLDLQIQTPYASSRVVTLPVD
jgi:minor extracellular serine protease Vpr